jgi:hypothetical protein
MVIVFAYLSRHMLIRHLSALMTLTAVFGNIAHRTAFVNLDQRFVTQIARAMVHVLISIRILGKWSSSVPAMISNVMLSVFAS